MSNVIYDYHKLCKDVKNLDKKIRFAGVINERGRLVASEIRKNVHIVHLDVSEKWATERLLKRGREDDNLEEIKSRLEWFQKNVVPAIDFLKDKEGYMFHKIDGERAIGDIHNDITEVLGM